MRRYRALYDLPEKPEPQLRVVIGNHYDDYLNAEYRREREERAATMIECNYCLKIKPGAGVSRIGGHDICTECAQKIAPAVLDAPF